MMRFSCLASCIGAAAALQVGTETSFNGTDAESLEGGNLCMMGQLAPKFFLLGTPKGGTTFFFEDFARSPQVVNYEPSESEPSWHSKEPWIFANGFDVEKKGWWLSHYPKCTQEKHLVAVDCTPGYFGSEYAAFSIQKAYGAAKHSLVFMVFLREPISRAHSHYYQYQENGVFDGAFGECSPQQFPKKFEHAVTSRLSNKRMCNCACDDIFEDSMYVDSFRRYFKNFASSMFHVVPFKLAVTGAVVEYACKVLNVERGHGEKEDLAGGDNLENHHDYPSLEEEMAPTLLKQFQSFMNSMAGPKSVARLLAGTDAHLYGYEGQKNSTSGIASWLSENW